MKYDKPLLAFFLGVLAAIPYEIYTRIMIYFGIGKYSGYQLSSMIVTLNRPTEMMGFVTSSLVGGTTALLFYYILKKVGVDYILLKSVLTGLLSWVLTELLYVWLIEGTRIIPFRPINDYYLHMSGSIIFGLILGVLFKKYLRINSLNTKG